MPEQPFSFDLGHRPFAERQAVALGTRRSGYLGVLPRNHQKLRRKMMQGRLGGAAAR
nr:hypothetical protein CDS [Bradyrhizobium sp.]